MSLSNSFVYTETAQQLCYDALSFLGLTDGTEDTVDQWEYQLALRSLNRFLKSRQVKNDGSGGTRPWLRRQGYLFLAANTGQYVLNANSGIWTESFDVVNSAGDNAPGATTINLAGSNGSLSNTLIANNDYVNLVLDDNTLWSTEITGSNAAANTITIAVAIPSSLNSSNPLYFFSTPAQPPQYVTWANLRDQNGYDTELGVLTYEEFCALPAKNSPGFLGIPSAVYYEPHLVGNAGQGYGLLNTDVDGCTDLLYYLVLNFGKEIDDMVNAEDELDAPKEWFDWVVTEVAFRLHPHFEVAWTQTRELLRQEAKKIATQANPKTLAYRYSRKRQSWTIQPHR